MEFSVKIREATAEDRVTWNTFVDNEDGNYGHYFDWKDIYETSGVQFIPLLMETSTPQLVGILPIVKENGPLYSVLHAYKGGLLLSKNLSGVERHKTILALVKHIDSNYSRRCSRFELYEHFPSLNQFDDEPNSALIESGFRFRYDKLTGLPCKFVVKLKQPFEDTIWRGLWSSSLRNKLKRAKKRGIVVIHDQDLDYLDTFVDMLSETYKRHENAPPTRKLIDAELNTFKGKIKLFVALRVNQPIAAILCHYYADTCELSSLGSWARENQDATALCYASIIEDACNAGYRFADLTVATTQGMVFFKERFKGVRIPYGSYEKRYSITRFFIEMVPVVFKEIRRDKLYIWKIRGRLWDRIING